MEQTVEPEHCLFNDRWSRTQLSVLGAAEGVDVAFAVHHHAELGSAAQLHQRLALVQDLDGTGRRSRIREERRLGGIVQD